MGLRELGAMSKRGPKAQKTSAPNGGPLQPGDTAAEGLAQFSQPPKAAAVLVLRGEAPTPSARSSYSTKIRETGPHPEAT